MAHNSAIYQPAKSPQPDDVQIKFQSLCDRLDAMLSYLETIALHTLKDSPQDYDRQISDAAPVSAALFGKRHLFVFTPVALTITAQPQGVIWQLTANSWTNVSVPEGAVFMTSGQASPVTLHFRATNEVTP